MATRTLQAGASSKIITVVLRDSTGALKTAVAYGSVTYAYSREGDNARSYGTCVTMTLDTWSTGGWVEVDATNHPGKYQFSVPNAAIATGAVKSTITFKGTGFVDQVEHVILKAYDDYTAVRTTYPMVKNVSGPFDFDFYTDAGALAPSKTITATRSINGGAFASATGTLTEIGYGAYHFAPSAADVNGDTVVFRFTCTGCQDRLVFVNPQG